MGRRLAVPALALAMIIVGGCMTGVPMETKARIEPSPIIQLPAALIVDATPTCEPRHCSEPVADPWLQALDYVVRHYPGQGCTHAEPEARMSTLNTPSGVFEALAGGDCVVMVPYGQLGPIVVTNDVTGFRWQGHLGGRFVAEPCCTGGGITYPELQEDSVSIPGPETRQTETTCTPEPCEPTALEHDTLVALLEYFGEHYAGPTAHLRGLTWMMPIGTWYRSEADQYLVERGDWLIVIPRGDPPYRVVAQQKASGFRWEGTIDWRPAWTRCRCDFGSSITETSVTVGQSQP